MEKRYLSNRSKYFTSKETYTGKNSIRDSIYPEIPVSEIFNVHRFTEFPFGINIKIISVDRDGQIKINRNPNLLSDMGRDSGSDLDID